MHWVDPKKEGNDEGGKKVVCEQENEPKYE
jgi:hypothetical protein